LCPSQSFPSTDSSSVSDISSSTDEEPSTRGCIPNPSQIPNATISELECKEVKIVYLPFALNWTANQDGIAHTGFRMAISYDTAYAVKYQGKETKQRNQFFFSPSHLFAFSFFLWQQLKSKMVV
jgi:hypothetical protein